MMRRNRAKTQILNWYDKGSPSRSDRNQFSRNIDIFFDTISERSHWKECLSTLLDDQGQANFSLSGNGWRASPTERGLVVTSILPGWGFGWHNVFSDEYSYDVFSWLGHYCRQYIHRSNVSKVLMATWERHGIVLHPFGSWSSSKRYGVYKNGSDQAEVFSVAKAEVTAGLGEYLIRPVSYRSKWAIRNTLDPSIHQGIFHFLRGQSLLKADFELEALVALDCVIHSLQYMDWSWAGGNAKRNRRDLCRALGLPSAEL